MVITRKIQVFICEDDKDLRKSYYEKLYDAVNTAVRVANMTVSHLFALDNTMPYLSPEDKETITFLGVKGDKATKANAPYVVASEAFKGKCSMKMLSNLQQIIRKQYDDDRKKGMWNKSLRSYKSDIPIPFQKTDFSNFAFKEYTNGEGKQTTGCFFTVMGIPFQMRFGRDRSNNKVIVERVLNGEYKMCTSSIQCIGSKTFLLLCVDIPQVKVKLTEGKRLFAFLGVHNPIVCTTEVNAKKEYDSGMKVYEIGTKDEFNHRRRQIQEAVRRCQIENRYSVGGRGRKKKCQAIDRFHEKENNYVDTKLHTYSKMLIDLALKYKCAEIVLMNQKHREDEAKEANKDGDNYVLRNWTYFGLKDKISYKCKKYGIALTVEK